MIDLESSDLLWYYILIISRSSLSIKVIGSRSRSHSRKCYLDCSLNWCSFLIRPRSLTMPRSYNGQGHSKVNVISMSTLSVSLSIGKWEVGRRLKGILVQCWSQNCLREFVKILFLIKFRKLWNT